MTYIVQRKDRFYVVAYDGLDPLTGRNDGGGTQSDTTVTKPKRSPSDSPRTPGLLPGDGGPVTFGES